MSSAAPPPATPAGDDAVAARDAAPDADGRTAETPFSPDGTLPPDAPLVAAGDAAAVAEEREKLRAINARPLPGRLAGYVKLSGPGWLQSALTLGGGSLAGSLYLGVIAGFGLLWLQPVAMALGICMLSAIAYVTLSTGQRPFRAINKHVNPALGWGWLLASGAANVVWALPQYSLGTAAVRQNLLPGLMGDGGGLSEFAAKAVVCGVMLAVALAVTWSYGSGHWGVRVFEAALKVAVGLIVLCFVAVVVRLSAAGELDWGAVSAGFVPDLGALFRPAPALQELVDRVAAADPAAGDYWAQKITDTQRDKLMTAFATAVGINMTFLLPYSMLGRGWGREHRGLGVFDLATGMFVPFFLATTCVVIASATQFHGVARTGVDTGDAGYAALLAADAGGRTVEQNNFLKDVDDFLKPRIAADGVVLDDLTPGELETELAARRPAVAETDRLMIATLGERDANALSGSLEPVFGGKTFADLAFGLGVLGMALSTICLLMLVSGFVVCEVLNVPATGWAFRLGALLPCVGALGPFAWSGASFYLAVPTSVAGLVLLPAAYLTFLLLMNKRELLGDAMPTGGMRVAVNAVLGLATLVSLFGAGWAVQAKIGWSGLAGVTAALVAALVAGEVVRRREAGPPNPT